MGGTHREVRSGRCWVAGALALFVGLGLDLPAHGELPPRYALADLKALEGAFVELAEQVRPSVVAIRTYLVSNADAPSTRGVLRPFNQGSGFVIDSEGFIATNRHVIAGADVISVILHTGIRHDATVVQSDRRSDLAVLEVDAENLKAVQWGDLQNVKINQWAFACGNPFGLANRDGGTSVTFGVVSALGREMTRRLVGNSDNEYYGNLIETSATINPGNSGGPLFNVDGGVIGIVTAIETSSGVSEGHGFAIPIDKNTRRILDTLKVGKAVRYGFLGIEVGDVAPRRSVLVTDPRSHRGARVERVSFADGPAAKAGLKAKDIVIEYDGVPVEDSDHLVRLVGYTPVGTQVPVSFIRKGVTRRTVVTVGDRHELLSRVDRSD